MELLLSRVLPPWLEYTNGADKRAAARAEQDLRLCARRGGITPTWDELNKYFGISGMPIASGQYWNGIHRAAPGQAAGDAEGLQQMRTLARNMAFLMKSIRLGRKQLGLPEREPGVSTNFIR